MPESRRIPTEAETAAAIRELRLAYLRQRLLGDRLLWAATGAVLDADTTLMVLRDRLINRDGAS